MGHKGHDSLINGLISEKFNCFDDIAAILLNISRSTLKMYLCLCYLWVDLLFKHLKTVLNVVTWQSTVCNVPQCGFKDLVVF